MIYINYMYRFFLSFFVFFILVSCVTHPSKPYPEYPGVDKQIKPIVDLYLRLSARKHIVFHHVITIGFKKIKNTSIIGETHYGHTWREIDIDEDFWNNSTAVSKITLVLHELTHGYCYRMHDYGDGKEYPNALRLYLHEVINLIIKYDENGMLEDGCPASIMFPIVLSDYCMTAHNKFYLDEMFERCNPF